LRNYPELNLFGASRSRGGANIEAKFLAENFAVLHKSLAEGNFAIQDNPLIF